MIGDLGRMTLERRLEDVQTSRAADWAITGAHSRPDLHGLLRYPAMMVPSMQGDLIDVLVSHVGTDCRVADTFVGSGTILTEALQRGLDFVGCDINPLAVLVCQAKICIDQGADVDGGVDSLLSALAADRADTVDVDFPGLAKWFTAESAKEFSHIRRAIRSVDDADVRKVLWTTFAETIRLCSNSRTSTYKLHARPQTAFVPAEKVMITFRENLSRTLEQIRSYRRKLSDRAGAPKAFVQFGDIRSVEFTKDNRHTILVTSPPYGDNQTTITYGQFSYLALCWIPAEELPQNAAGLLASTHTIDSASLGGSLKLAREKSEKIGGISPSLDHLLQSGRSGDQSPDLRKVAAFMADFYEALVNVRMALPGSGHWVMTTGNRRAVGRTIPFDAICREMLSYLGGRPVAALHRTIPTKRMPTKNNLGAMMTTETTLIAEFA